MIIVFDCQLCRLGDLQMKLTWWILTMSSWRAFFRRSITSRRLSSSLAMTTGRQLSSWELFEATSGISSRLELDSLFGLLCDLRCEGAEEVALCFLSAEALLGTLERSAGASRPDSAHRASPPFGAEWGLFNLWRTCVRTELAFTATLSWEGVGDGSKLLESLCDCDPCCCNPTLRADTCKDLFCFSLSLGFSLKSPPCKINSVN